MKIGVISDTHLRRPDEGLERLNHGIFADVELVLHAGDLTHINVLEAFGDKTVKAVCGNMDGHTVSQSLPAREIIRVEGFRIALVHGWGAKGGLEERIRESLSDVNAIVYGHSHRAANHVRDGVLLFNPGAYSGSFMMHGNRSVGLLHVDARKGIRGEIIPL